jgi:hypothetical protein
MNSIDIINGKSCGGFFPNPLDYRDKAFHFGHKYSQKQGLPLPPLPDEVSLRAHIGQVYSQSVAPSCVAMAVAKAIEITERRSYRLKDIPSRAFIFWNSRAYHGDQRRYTGTHIRSALSGVSHYGAPDERFMQYDPSMQACTKRPPLRAYFASYGKESRRKGLYETCFDVEGYKVKAIQEAIVRGFPVIFGTSIDEEFTKSRGPVLIDVPRNPVSRHAMAVIGYRTGDKGIEFEVLNSWGLSWRAEGVAWLTEEYIRWAEFRDVCIYFGWSALLL